MVLQLYRFILIYLMLTCSIPAIPAQIIVSGGQMVIQTGTSMVATGLSIHNLGGAVITNQGTLATSQDISNASGGTLNGDGIWQLSGDWINAGVFTAGSSTVLFDGNGPSQATTGGAPFYQLHLHKNANNLALASAAQVNDEVRFVSDSNLVICSDFNFTIGNAALITGADSDNYFVTNDTGALIREALDNASFTFPVGATTDTYNPLILGEDGAPDNIAVRCLAQPLLNGNSGMPLAADAIAAAWELSEGTSGGSSLTATAQWNASDELSGFDHTDCGLTRFNTGTDWDLPPANMGASAGSGPYTRLRSNLSPGIITVMDKAYLNRVKIAARIMLQGPYNPTTMQMNDNLRTLAAFPLTAPTTYGTGKFVHTGWQPANGYQIDPAVLTVTGNDAIVDWVFMWLKDTGNPAVNIQTRVALLQKDGDVVDLDGISPVYMPANAGNYILGIGHRNHLSVRSPNGPGIALNEFTVTSYNFTSAMSQAYGTNPMQQVQTTPTAIFALWGGNTSVNNSVRATGPPSINDYSVILNVLGYPTNILTNVYSNADVNMDGKVRVTGPPTINDYSKLLNILGTPTTIINEQQ